MQRFETAIERNTLGSKCFDEEFAGQTEKRGVVLKSDLVERGDRIGR